MNHPDLVGYTYRLARQENQLRYQGTLYLLLPTQDPQNPTVNYWFQFTAEPRVQPLAWVSKPSLAGTQFITGVSLLEKPLAHGRSIHDFLSSVVLEGFVNAHIHGTREEFPQHLYANGGYPCADLKACEMELLVEQLAPFVEKCWRDNVPARPKRSA